MFGLIGLILIVLGILGLVGLLATGLGVEIALILVGIILVAYERRDFFSR